MVNEAEKKIVESLSPIERRVLPLLKREKESVEKISEKAKIDKTSVLRALEYLKKKNIVEVFEEEKKIVDAGINGIYYRKKGLPERRLLDYLGVHKHILLSEIQKSCELNENEVRVSLGVLKKKALVDVKDGRIVLNAKREEIEKKMLEEVFLESLPRELNGLEPQEKLALQNLRDRKEIVEIVDEKKIFGKISEYGERFLGINLDEGLIEQLSSKIIRSNSWKGKKFRRYDLSSGVPRIFGGKRNFVNQSIDYAKKIWLELGFKEMSGDYVTTSFWNFDALFTPQDHPARDIQDSFFIQDVETKFPEKSLVNNVKKMHEGNNNIFGGNSSGWSYSWDEEKSKSSLLRTHTTCLSAKTLKKIAETKEFPAKYFAVGKCFRNETVDWSHGFEFDQTEGIVVDENANFRQLLGYLVQFYKKMGYEKIRVRPHYFPYTEPSVEIDVWNSEKKKWVETGGAGMFRPEVTTAFFGRHIPVLAWGQGFSRIIMEYFKITDLRDMHKNNLNKLRDMKFWMR